MLSKFRADLIREGIIVIIGYSFRDEPINNAIIERISKDKEYHVKLVIVSSNPEETIPKNILPEFQPKFQQCATLVKTHLGDKNSISLIIDGIETKRCAEGFSS